MVGFRRFKGEGCKGEEVQCFRIWRFKVQASRALGVSRAKGVKGPRPPSRGALPRILDGFRVQGSGFRV